MADHETGTVELDADLSARLRLLAASMGRDVSSVARDIIRSHMDLAEQGQEFLHEDESRWQQYLATGETLSADEVRRRLHDLALLTPDQPQP